MKRNAANATVLLALLLAALAAVDAQSRNYNINQDLLRLLAEKNWLGGAANHWDGPRVTPELSDDGPVYHDDGNYIDDEIRAVNEKRSAVATALNGGRRRRQPAPAFGKAVTPFVGVGVLNDVGSYFDSLRENLETIASLSPEERSTFFPEPPSVVHAPASGGGGGRGKIFSMRPFKPIDNMRYYNRRSYPGGTPQYDPRPLWIGLGR